MNTVTSQGRSGGANKGLWVRVRGHGERACARRVDASDWRGNMSTAAAAQLNNNEEPGLNGKTPFIFPQED